MGFTKLIIVCCVILSVSCATYYVSPFGSDSNPGTQAEPFRTISKGASYASSTTTLILMSGTFAGSGNSGISLTSSLNVQAQPNVFVSCSQTTNTEVFYIYGTNMNIQIAGFTISGCSRAVYIYGYSSTSRANVHLDKMVLTNLPSAGIITSGTNLTVDNSYFNELYQGISQSGYDSYLTIRNTMFQQISNNAISAVNCRAPLLVTGSNFTEGTATAISSGCDLTVKNSTFSNSSAINGTAIQANDSSVVQVISSIFIELTASSCGGAIFIEANSNVAISNVTFYRNSANYGGAIYSESATMNVAESDFAYNTANVAGGGFYCVSGQNYISDSVFASNSAPTGPAYACQGCSTHTNNLQFTGSGKATSC